MAYVKTDWENLPSTDTPINETALDNIENGIEYNDQRLNGTKPMGSIVVDDINCKNLCNGINQNVFLTSAVNSGQILSGNTGLYIKVNGGNYTISTTTSQARYRVACMTNEPTTTAQTAYNGVNKDGTSDTITIDTTGYDYLIVNATDLSKIQIEPGSEATPYVEYKDFGIISYPVRTYSFNGLTVTAVRKGFSCMLVIGGATNVQLNANTFYDLTLDDELTPIFEISDSFFSNEKKQGMIRITENSKLRIYPYENMPSDTNIRHVITYIGL